jgi:nucleoside-diphosphate-sugar epimerase
MTGTAVASTREARERADQVRDEDLDVITSEIEDELRAMSGRRLLITGGAGFLGYYLVQVPLRWNDRHPDEAPIDVTVYDNYIRGVPEWLGELGERRDTTISTFDLREPLPPDFGGFAWIIHAAGIASPQYYRANPIATMDANIVGLRNLLDYAKDRVAAGEEFGGFLFYSSSEIYGDPDPASIPTPETYRGFVSCTGPRACYDESKRYGETLCVNFAEQYGVPVRMARPFNNFGPGMKITDGRVIADLCRDVLAGRDPALMSDGTPTRTFCYASDAVTGYYRALLLGGDGEPYNIGTQEPEVSMRELAETTARLAKELFGQSLEVTFRQSAESNYLVDNPNRRCPDTTKSREQIGYDAKVGFEEGLRRTLTWYAGNQGGSEA